MLVARLGRLGVGRMQGTPEMAVPRIYAIRETDYAGEYPLYR